MPKYPSLLVISSCTGAKLHKPPNQLVIDDFRKGGDHLRAREQELAEYRTSAKRLYTGAQHQQVSQAFDVLSKSKGIVSRLEIISAGYGLIDQYKFIVPYETSFNELKSREVLDWSKQLGIHEALNARIKSYDIVIFLLGENYLKSALLPLQSRPDQSFIFLASGGSAAVLPEHAAKQAVLPLVNKDARRFGYGMVGLKGFLFHQLARAVAEDPEVLHDWHADPQSAITYLENWQAARTAPTLMSEAEEAAPAPLMPVTTGPSIHRTGLGFNPLNLSSEAFYPKAQHELAVPPRARFTVVINNRDKLKLTQDHEGAPLPAPKMERIWNFIETDPRGYLTSLAYHNPNSDPLPQTDEGNIYDCGAWSYKAEPYPILKKRNGPLTPEGTMKLFEEAGAREGRDIIVSPDMMILDGLDSPQVAREKIEISYQFARAMKPLAGAHRLMAVTHGSFEQRHEMMEHYLDLGYRHIALGSLALKSSRDPYFVYRCVEDALQYRAQVPDLYIHVLGVSSIKWAATLTHLGVDSFDGSSMYMSAFTAGSFLQYVPEDPNLLKKYRIVENVPGSDELPPCHCPACSAMRAEGWDTRAQGGTLRDPSGRPYNGGNEANMGRAVHNINMYLRALQDVQARILAGDESLLVKRDRYEAARERRDNLERPMERLLN